MMEQTKSPLEMSSPLLDAESPKSPVYGSEGKTKAAELTRTQNRASLKITQGQVFSEKDKDRLVKNGGDNDVMNPEDSIDCKIVFWETLYNFLFPLSFPVIYWREGWIGLHNRMFLPSIGKMFYYQMLVGTLFFSLNIIFFAKGSEIVCFSEVLLINVYMFIRCLVIGVKYGVLGEKKLKKKRKKVCTMEYLQEELLMGGWLSLPDKLIEKEIRKSFMSRGLNEKACHVLLHSDEAVAFQQCAIFNQESNANEARSSEEISYDTDDDVDSSGQHSLESDDSANKDIKTPILLRDVLSLFICHSNEEIKSWPIPILKIVLGGIHAIIPIIGHVLSGKPVIGNGSPLELLCLFSSFCLTFTLWTNNFGFLAISYLDGIRRLRVMTLYGILAQTRCRSRVPSYFRCNLPRLSLKHPINIVNWLAGRGVIQVFGRKYLQRIEISVALYFLGLFGLLIFLFVTSIQKSLELTMTMLFTYDFLILGAVLFLVIDVYGDVNQLVSAHTTVVIYEQLRIREALAEPYHSKDDTHRYENCDRLLESVRLILSSDEERFSVKFLGFSVSRGWSNVALSFLLSGVSVGVKIILDM